MNFLRKYLATPNGYLFSNTDLVRLIIPILIETIMIYLVASCDSLMVATLGEEASGGISVSGSIHYFVSIISMALGVGGSLVAAQALGAKKIAFACKVARQQIQAVFLLGMLLTLLVELFTRQLFCFLYPKISEGVLKEAVTYTRVIGITYSISAVRWGIASLFRIMEKPHQSMICAIMANIINVCLNALFIYVFNWGVAGAAWATVASLTFSFTVMLTMISNKRNPIWFRFWEKPSFDGAILKKLVYFGGTHAIEEGIFQLGCILTVGIVVAHGKEQLAVYSIIMSCLCNFSMMFAVAGDTLVATVIGQSTGVGDVKQTRFYVKRMLLLIYSGHIVSNVLLLCCLPLLFMFYRNFTAETMRMTRFLLCFYFPITTLIWPMAFPFGTMLRAMNDVKFVMYLSIVSMFVFRVAFGYVLDDWLHNGIYAIIFAMFLDWGVRSFCFYKRYASNRWLKYYLNP